MRIISEEERHLGCRRGNERESVLITPEIVQKIAGLAHLQLTEAELDRMTAELGAILDHIATLTELQTDHIAPTAQVQDLHNVMRDDSVRASLPLEAVMANAPDREDGNFRVRAVLDEDLDEV